MQQRAITIRVNAEAAHVYENAGAEDRRKLDALLSLKLTEATRATRSLEEVMDEISRNAQQRGLTPEILDQILHER